MEKNSFDFNLKKIGIKFSKSMGNTFSKKEVSLKKKLFKTTEEVKNYKNQLHGLVETSTNIKNKFIITSLLFYTIFAAIVLISEKNFIFCSSAYFSVVFAIFLLISKFFSFRINRLKRHIKKLEIQHKKKIEEFKHSTDFLELRKLIEEQEIEELTERESEHKNFSKSKTSVFENITDIFIGEDPSKKYALICKNCKRNNGLCLPEKIKTMKFVCYFCKIMNENNE